MNEYALLHKSLPNVLIFVCASSLSEGILQQI